MEGQKDIKRRPEKVCLFIFHDLLGESAFKIRSESKLNNLVTLCRRHSINLMFTTQYLTAIPPIKELMFVYSFFLNSQIVKDY
jgi:hypothetical protein